MNTTIFDQWLSSEEEKEIKELVKTSKPSANSKFSLTEIKEQSGWIDIKAKINDSKFSINHSAYVWDTSILIKFFKEIIELKEEIVLMIDYEGSDPILYSAPVDENKVRFLFAHDYDLFLNDDVDDYKITDYKIECDIIIDKKELIKKFYDILYPFTINYNIKKASKGHYDDVFNIENGKKYLNEIKIYLESQID